MCRLTGAARHPKHGAPVADVAKIVTTLLEKSEYGGRHATGIAVCVAREEPKVLKRAVPANVFIKSSPFLDFMATSGAHPDISVLLGHTRYASHANGHVDEAAHPFVDGTVVGAHNGMISNWREVEAKIFGGGAQWTNPKPWINDSQAAFAMLDRTRDPVIALDSLDGWFALTWVKNGHLLMTRTNNIELSAAYVPSMRTLFWHSDKRVLLSVLGEYGIGVEQFDAWTLQSNAVYRYDPSSFDDKSANGTKRDAPFRGIGADSKARKVNALRPNETSKGGGYSTTRTISQTSSTVTYPNGRSWDKYTGRELEPVELSSKIMSLGEIDKKFRQHTDLIVELFAKLESLEQEKNYLYEVLNEKYPEVFDGDSHADDDEPGPCGIDPDQLCLPRIEKPDDDMNVSGKPRFDTTDDGRQFERYMDNGHVRRRYLSGDATRCAQCGGSDGELLNVPDGTKVHPNCIMLGDA